MKLSIYNPLPYYSLVILYAIFYISTTYLQNPFITIWIVFGLLPFLDQVLPHDLVNPTKEEQRSLKNLTRFKIPILISIALDWFSLFWSINELLKNDLNILYKTGIFSFTIIMQGSAFTTSHELNHKPNIFDKLIGTLSMSKSFYMHFLIAHNQGHHRDVATFDDPATSRFNESYYRFLPRTIYGTFVSAWEIENRYCDEKHGTACTLRNRMIWFTLAILLFPLIFLRLYGYKGMMLQIAIGIGSVMLLELVNYIEHYGLKRKKLESGQYENVNNTHSWNAPHRMTNYMLFKLQRHSDHHENALKPYQNLCTYEDSPLLPNGYPLCIIMALYPKLWFDIMNPVVQSYQNGGKPSPKLIETNNKKLFKFVFDINIFLFAVILIQFGVNLYLN